MRFDQPPVVRVSVDGGLPPQDWPMTIPAVAQLARDGLELSPFVTFLVGENGSGKSTIVEAVAEAFGLGTEGGSTGSRHSTRPSESPLGTTLRLQRGLGASRRGFFLPRRPCTASTATLRTTRGHSARVPGNRCSTR